LFALFGVSPYSGVGGLRVGLEPLSHLRESGPVFWFGMVLVV
jgi:hypothetical protein